MITLANLRSDACSLFSRLAAVKLTEESSNVEVESDLRDELGNSENTEERPMRQLNG